MIPKIGQYAKDPFVREALATWHKPPEKDSSAIVKRSPGASLCLQAYESLKERIILLAFLPGQYLNEAAICSMLDLGRTPVHQALQRLQLEGLVKVMPRKGVMILSDSVSQVHEIIDSRLAVEPELARKAAETPMDPLACEELTAMAVKTPESDVPDIAAFTIADLAFHSRVGQLSGNKLMSDFAQRLHERSTRFWYLHLWQTLDIPKSNSQHAAIAAAICRGDGEGAAKAMRVHIMELKNILRALEQSAPPRHLSALSSAPD